MKTSGAKLIKTTSKTEIEFEQRKWVRAGSELNIVNSGHDVVWLKDESVEESVTSAKPIRSTFDRSFAPAKSVGANFVFVRVA